VLSFFDEALGLARNGEMGIGIVSPFSPIPRINTFIPGSE
jgi:hypothetical protein